MFVVKTSTGQKRRKSQQIIARRYWLALYRRDLIAAEEIVDRCIRDWPPARIYMRLFEPAMVLSGQAFLKGKIHWRDEHYITHNTLRFLRKVRRKFVIAKPTGKLALATGIASSSHLIGLRMVCDFLQSANWRIHWLESNDRGAVRSAARKLKPDALLLSISLDEGVIPAKRIVSDLRRNGFKGIVIIGGRVVNVDPKILTEIGADLTAHNGLLLLKELRNHTDAITDVRGG